MPTINLYVHKPSFNDQDLAKFKAFSADTLSCSERKLQNHEVSLRVVEVQNTTHMIAPVECEIKAHHYPERVERQDEICSVIKSYLMEYLTNGKEVSVWLELSELGHSF